MSVQIRPVSAVTWQRVLEPNEPMHAALASHVHWRTQEHNTQARQLYDRIASRSDFIQYRQLFG